MANIRRFGAKFPHNLGNSRQNHEVSRQRSNIPNTPTARRARVLELIATQTIRSQAQLEALLAQDGLEVTQATLSRDLDELGAIKIRDAAGSLVYAAGDINDGTLFGSADVREARVARVASEVLVSVEVSANIAVLRTTVAAAQFFASAIDRAVLDDVIGTVAGDDTVFVVTKAPDGAQAFASYITQMAERHAPT